MSVELETEDYRSILEDLPAGFCVVDRARRIQLWSRGAEELTGYLSQEAIGRDCASGMLMHCDSDGASLCGERCPLSQAMRDGHTQTVDALLLHKDGARIPVRIKTAPVRGEGGSILGAATLFEERLWQAEEAPRLGGFHLDPETQLPDRSALQSRLETSLHALKQSGEPFGVLVFAIDRLGDLLHVDGRNGIEIVFHTIGRTLSENVKPEEVVGRWSEQCFLVILKTCSHAALRSRAEYLQRVAGLAAAPWWGERISVTVSAGGALAAAEDTPFSLTQRAEDALHASEGGNQITLADDMERSRGGRCFR